MKIKSIITAAFIITLAVLSLTLNAAGKINADPMSKLLQQSMKVPDHLKAEISDGFVLVSFTVDEAGVVTVLQTNASSTTMNAYVVHRLNGMKLDAGVAERSKTYYMKFIFKTI